MTKVAAPLSTCRDFYTKAIALVPLALVWKRLAAVSTRDAQARGQQADMKRVIFDDCKCPVKKTTIMSANSVCPKVKLKPP